MGKNGPARRFAWTGGRNVFQLSTGSKLGYFRVPKVGEPKNRQNILLFTPGAPIHSLGDRNRTKFDLFWVKFPALAWPGPDLQLFVSRPQPSRHL